ncbi:MAG: FtsX-like permease family protein [Balneolaceae bacterium]|nr:FtsX-like permease family protein [Balneolaceae bacterium]
MIKSDLKISWRSLRKQPFFTFLNTFGLAIGIAGVILISLFIYDEFSYDTMFADADQIYRIDIENKNAGEVNSYAAAPGPLANRMRQDYPHIEQLSRFMNMGTVFMRRENSEIALKEKDVVAADSAFLNLFGISMLEGDPATALANPNSVVLTTSEALEHFGTENVMGESLIKSDGEIYTITGLVRDMPRHSFLRDHGIFFSLSSFEEADDKAWNNWIFPTFVKLRSSANQQHLDEYLSDVKERYIIPWAMTFVPGLTLESARESAEKTGDYMRFSSIALTDIHLYSPNKNGEFSQNSDIQSVYILGIIGLFLIVLAVVNFMNLSTAQSLKRAKEVGVRKTLGSIRFDLIRQFLTESILVSFLSSMLAVFIAFETLPLFNALSGKTMSLPLTDPVFWGIIISGVLVLGLLSGFYPSFFMSRFVPIQVLKGSNMPQVGGGNIRNSLVVFQFAISIILIVGTLVVHQQLTFIQNKDLGFQKNQVLVIDDVNTAGHQLQTFKEEVKRLNEVKNASLSSFLPTPSARNGVTFFLKGEVLEPESAIIMGNWRVDYDYLSTLNLELIAGRGFDESFGTDSSAIILNESAVTMMGMKPEEVIGMQLTNDFRRSDKENMKYITIIGVMKNFHYETMRNRIDGMSLVLGNNPDKMMVKLRAGAFSDTIAEIENIWSDVSPGQPMNYYFMDDSFNDVYQSELRLGRVFLIFTALSILISCLGLFGLATFNAERRIKEIGIRKVLGASVPQIIAKLSTDFLKLVAIASLIALPAGWYIMNRWLQDFSYRIDIGIDVFLIAAGVAITISLLTISYQSIKAAMLNPVQSLKNE